MKIADHVLSSKTYQIHHRTFSYGHVRNVFKQPELANLKMKALFVYAGMHPAHEVFVEVANNFTLSQSY